MTLYDIWNTFPTNLWLFPAKLSVIFTRRSFMSSVVACWEFIFNIYDTWIFIIINTNTCYFDIYIYKYIIYPCLWTVFYSVINDYFSNIIAMSSAITEHLTLYRLLTVTSTQLNSTKHKSTPFVWALITKTGFIIILLLFFYKICLWR